MPPGRPPKRTGELSEHDAPDGQAKCKISRLDRPAPNDFSSVVKSKLQSYTRTGQACDRCKVRFNNLALTLKLALALILTLALALALMLMLMSMSMSIPLRAALSSIVNYYRPTKPILYVVVEDMLWVDGGEE